MAWTVFSPRLALGRELLLPRAPGPRILLPWREAARQGSSSTRWKQRQTNDVFAREAKVQGLKSRAAFKLLEMDAKYHLFKKGQVVVDLGFAPGSWSQVAVERTKPSGRVVGIDILPAQPPKGVSTIQGNFLSPVVHAMVKEFLVESDQRRRTQKDAGSGAKDGESPEAIDPEASETAGDVTEPASYLEMERRASHVTSDSESAESTAKDGQDERLVDVSSSSREITCYRVSLPYANATDQIVLSDMSAPWPQLHGFSANSINNPYRRMMNTSGISFKDHAGSMVTAPSLPLFFCVPFTPPPKCYSAPKLSRFPLVREIR